MIIWASRALERVFAPTYGTRSRWYEGEARCRCGSSTRSGRVTIVDKFREPERWSGARCISRALHSEYRSNARATRWSEVHQPCVIFGASSKCWSETFRSREEKLLWDQSDMSERPHQPVRKSSLGRIFMFCWAFSDLLIGLTRFLEVL